MGATREGACAGVERGAHHPPGPRASQPGEVGREGARGLFGARRGSDGGSESGFSKPSLRGSRRQGAHTLAEFGKPLQPAVESLLVGGGPVLGERGTCLEECLALQLGQLGLLVEHLPEGCRGGLKVLAAPLRLVEGTPSKPKARTAPARAAPPARPGQNS